MRSSRVLTSLAAISAAMVAAVGCVAQGPPDPTLRDTAVLESPGAMPLVYDVHDGAARSVSLMVGDPLGTEALNLTNAPDGWWDTHPVRSPDGERVVFMRENETGVRIAIVSVDDPDSLTFVDTGCEATPDCEDDINPTWTADGSRLVFTRVMGPFHESGGAASAAMYSTRLDGSDLRRVSTPDLPAPVEEGGARYTPDGRYIVYIRDADVDGVLRFAIFRMRLDATEITQLTPWTLNADRPVPSPAQTGPTAGMVAFETLGGAEPGRGDIALLPWTCVDIADCTSKTTYVTHNSGGPRSSYAATWSPDGLFLAFAEEPAPGRGGNIWTSRWDGTQRSQITHERFAFSPSWAT